MLLALFVLATVVPVSVSIAQIRSGRDDAERQASATASQAGQLVSDQVQEVIGDAISIARILERTPSFWSADDAERDRQLEVLVPFQPLFVGVLFMTPDLREHGSSNHVVGAPRLDLSSRAYAAEAVATQSISFGSAPLVTAQTQQQIVPIAVPIDDSSGGAPDGYIICGLLVANLPGLWATLPLPVGSSVMLVDGRDGTVLSAPRQAIDAIGQTLPAASVDDIRKTSSSWITSGGMTELRSSAAVQKTPWYVSIDVPEATIFGAQDVESRQLTTSAIVAGAVMLGLFSLVWWRFATRIGKLQETAEHWSRGDWEIRSGINGNDELGHVARSFDAMAEQRLQAMRALRDTEERFRLLVEGASSVALIFLDVEGQVTDWNLGAARLTGYEGAEILSQPVNRLFTWADQQQGVPGRLLDQASRSGSVRDVGFRVRKDGAVFWGEVFVTALRDDEGGLRGFAIIMSDATDRRRADELRRQQTEHLETVIEAQADIMQADLDPSLLMTLVADHARILTNADGGAVATLDEEGLVYLAGSGLNLVGTRVPLVGSLSGACMQTGEVLLCNDADKDWRVDRNARLATGVRSMIATPLKHSGRILGVLSVVARDPNRFDEQQVSTMQLMSGLLSAALQHAEVFDERTQAEAEARRIAGQLTAILRATTEIAIVGVGLDAKITFFGEGAERMLGYRADEVIGKHPVILHDPTEVEERRADGTSLSEVFLGRALQGEPHKREWTYVRKDGTTLTVDLVITPMTGDDGQLVGYIAVATDITQRKVVDRMKDEFISIVSHELRTPLTGIRGSLGLLASGVLGPISDQGQRMVDIALSNSERLIRMVSDMLDVERMESGRDKITPVECDLGEIMQQATAEMQSQADRAGVILDSDPLHVRIVADQDRITQVLTNLLSNAIKFSSAGGRVYVSGEQMANDRVRVQVSDEGRGIPNDQLEQIFERFQQVDASDARAKGGSGLGLAICRMIVEQHGGQIWATSTPGNGTQLWFELPLDAAAATSLG